MLGCIIYITTSGCGVFTLVVRDIVDALDVGGLTLAFRNFQDVADFLAQLTVHDQMTFEEYPQSGVRDSHARVKMSVSLRTFQVLQMTGLALTSLHTTNGLAACSKTLRLLMSSLITIDEFLPDIHPYEESFF